ncbi:MAG: cytochrome c biogenesis protein [candidate division SR1 bacterium]|nr:cytochrome c biogenesis protein [candidate division SR1 bacterium]
MIVMKYVIGIIVAFVAMISVSTAQEYILFYGNGCPHCAKVQEYIKDNKITQQFDLTQKEVFFNKKNLDEFNGYLEKHTLTYDKIGVPFLIINSGINCNYINGDTNIIDYFSGKLAQITAATCKDTALSGGVQPVEKSLKERLAFFGIMLPAAISDSINPCAFAVMLLLLSTILTRHKSRRKTLFAGGLFSLAVFLTYLAMGVGLFSALATANNTYILKLVVGILGIVVGLANLKDYFRYGKWFVMEVPFSRRPKMMALIENVSSPWGAFFVGVLVSLFLLPCSSGPYFTILGFMSSQSKNLNLRGYIYLIVYNLIFVLPMVAIAAMVAFGYASVDKIAKIKHEKTKLIHLIVGILMLGLGIYVLTTI